MPIKINKTILYAFILLVFINATTTVLFAQVNKETNPKQVIETMLKNIDNLRSLKSCMETTERNNDELAKGFPCVKLNYYPRYIYMKLKDNGVEFLWKDGWNGNKALANPNGFPFINSNVDPNSNYMREGHHHTIHERGFKYLAELIRFSQKKLEDKFYDHVQLKGSIAYDDKDCYLVNINYDDYAYTTYTSTGKENLIQIARKLNVPEHWVKEKNKLKGYGVVAKDIELVVPNNYGKKIVLYIDKKTFMPIYQRVEDDKGLYEQYEYVDCEINVRFMDSDFDEYNEQYGFH